MQWLPQEASVRRSGGRGNLAFTRSSPWTGRHRLVLDPIANQSANSILNEPSDENSVDLLQRWRDGDEQAAALLFDRYLNQLVGLARSRLSERMQRRVEPEDVVQSAYRSFFRKAKDGRYTLEKSGDLWRLLATITVSKLRGQVEFHTAKKRAVYTEESVAGGRSTMGVNLEAIVRDPSPDDAAAVIEELTNLMGKLEPVQRQILELALQNESVENISDQVHRSARTVRRTLQTVRNELENRLMEVQQ